MSQQMCPTCKTISMVWAMDEYNTTSWHCANCNFTVIEDESKESKCKLCNNFSLIYLTESHISFWWCLTCFTRYEVNNSQ